MAGGVAAEHEWLVLRGPRAILVDLDETLLDNSGVLESVARTCEVVAGAVGSLDPHQLRQANRQIWRSYWPMMEPLCWLGRIDGFTVSREAWRQTLSACGCTDAGVV
jgi:hypothetical protein